MLSLEPHERLQVPKAEAETFLELGKNTLSVEVAPDVTRDEDDSKPADCPFLTPAGGDISGAARTGPTPKLHSSLILRRTQLLFVIGVPMFLNKGIRITAGGVGRRLSSLR